MPWLKALESRYRILAFNRLRLLNCKVPAKILLGIIFEIPYPRGLDTLAVYHDHRIRYINQTGKIGILEAIQSYPPAFTAKIHELFLAGQKLVNVIGPWEQDRLDAPSGNTMRMTFLVSDGIYFGQGPMAGLTKDAKAAPVIRAGGEILALTVNLLLQHGQTLA